MKFWLSLIGFFTVVFGIYWIWSDVNGLLLIENVKDGYYHSYYIADDGKAKDALSFNFLAGDQGIYKYLAVPFALVFLVAYLLGIFSGFFLREPIDEYDFKALKEKTERGLELAQEEIRKAQEAAKNAHKIALKQARDELEHEKKQAQYQREEAEKERRAAIEAQQNAEAAIRKAQIERADALRIADNATRKKNAAYSAAERFKKKAEKATRTG
jgi:hypothetical protein